MTSTMNATKTTAAPEPKPKRRFRKVRDGDDGKGDGRYFACKPRDAASKAFTALKREKEEDPNNKDDPSTPIKFSVVEYVGGKPKKQYFYEGVRQILEHPLVTIVNTDPMTKKRSISKKDAAKYINMSDAHLSKLNLKRISYNKKNKITKDKERTIEHNEKMRLANIEAKRVASENKKADAKKKREALIKKRAIEAEKKRAKSSKKKKVAASTTTQSGSRKKKVTKAN